MSAVIEEEARETGLVAASEPPAETVRRRGRLTIFFGMSWGVGKTFAMLQAAQKEKNSGRDVVIGSVETRGDEAVKNMARSLPTIPPMQVVTGETVVAEMDVESLLARRPQLVLVDDLAHTNPVGLRHPKRFHDVLELLEAGIDVFTTLNVQNLASRADTVERITGATIRETVPDTVLDGAEMVVIDLSPEKLMQRFIEGKASLPRSTGMSHIQFFREGNLSALREMALRVAAERVGRDVANYMQTRQISGPWKSGHRLMVGVGPGAVSEQVICWARRLADSLNCPWVAVYVETSRRALAKAEQSRVTWNLSLARELGAEVVTTSDDDVVRGLLRVAAQRNVTQIVVGKPVDGPLWKLFQRDLVLRRLVRSSGDIDIHVVRAEKKQSRSHSGFWPRWVVTGNWRQYLLATSAVAGVSVVNYFLQPLIGVHATALVYLLAVVVLALFVEWGPTLAAAALSAAVWDYFFLPPVFAFRVQHFEDAMLLSMYFVVAIVLGQFTARIRAQEEAERQREERATALYLLTRELSESRNLEQMLKKVVEQTGRVFKAEVGLILHGAKGWVMPEPRAGSFSIDEREQGIAAWVFEHGQPAGLFTDNLPVAEALFVPLKGGSQILGVMALKLSQSYPPTVHQRNLLDAFSQQIGLALDRQRLQEISQKTRLLAESERLSKTLLNSVSHEIRTPIAAIRSAAANLAEFGETNLSEPQREMVVEIQQATQRLNRLVGNVLDMTRVETGHVKPKLNLCDVRDLAQVVAKETREQLAQHRVELHIAPKLPLVKMDFVLMQQALGNLLSNAAFHTPPGTLVRLAARPEGEFLVITVSDNGPGIPPESIPRIFDKFYRAPNARTGGTGLGLSLVKGFVEAQGGRVTAGNRPDGGAVFTIRLPLSDEKTEVVQ